MNTRTVFQSRNVDVLHLQAMDGANIYLLCTVRQLHRLTELGQALQQGSTLQLLNVKVEKADQITCEFIIFEPDYLIDISVLAECFRPYGVHPLNYILSRFRLPKNTRHILLGNAANFFIDELVNEQEDTPVDYRHTVQRLFKTSPFEFTACDDLKDRETEIQFFTSCQTQFENIRRVITQGFAKEEIERSKIVVEPSFISKLLGLQGRLDLMLQDFTAFVELKSGKAEEDFRSGTFRKSSLSHYTQMILYLALLEFNLKLPHEKVRSYLLYSRYPYLSKEAHSREQLEEVLQLRNRIVAIEYLTQHRNSAEYSDMLLSCITAGRLNTNKMSGRFFEQYLRPQIEELPDKIRALDETERAYFMRLYTFVVKEMWHAKVGEREYEGIKRPANLWNAPEEEKKAAGEFLYGLRMLENAADTAEHSLTLTVPDYGEYYMPNFRQGDAVILYRWSEGQSLGECQVFKGAIEYLSGGKIKIRLRSRQANTAVLPADAVYAVEHDYMDVGFTGMFKGLTAFADAIPERRDLLLGRRMPEYDPDFVFPDIEMPRENTLQEVLTKALAANDYFLLIGPPGTGKTSQALKRMVEHLCHSGKNILLLSYTNRAVDEICSALTSISPDTRFIRLGSELNCDPAYRPYLLDQVLKNCRRRSEVQHIIETTSIYVSTTATAWSKPELFLQKTFDTAVIDEASQLLEPHLLGILSAKNSAGQQAIKRFILIGDHKQLPAVMVQSDRESEVDEPILRKIGLRSLKESLFERLYRRCRENNWEHAYGMLDKQGRMHPDIAYFSSKHFYEGKLQAIGLPHQLPGSTVYSPFSQRILFFPSQRPEQLANDKTNEHEARIIVDYLTALCTYYRESELPSDIQTIGIITPYRSQIALIRKAIEEAEIAGLPDLTIDTVERFQGGQKDIILYSFCLNSPWQLQALPNCMEENGKQIDRKLNVVLTRARKQLVIVGNKELLLQNNLYASLIHFIENHPHQQIPLSIDEMQFG